MSPLSGLHLIEFSPQSGFPFRLLAQLSLYVTRGLYARASLPSSSVRTLMWPLSTRKSAQPGGHALAILHFPSVATPSVIARQGFPIALFGAVVSARAMLLAFHESCSVLGESFQLLHDSFSARSIVCTRYWRPWLVPHPRLFPAVCVGRWPCSHLHHHL